MMPDLPNVGWERDLESFREFFENPDFRSDGLKVCPCAQPSIIYVLHTQIVLWPPSFAVLYFLFAE